ncbi:MAG TPA: PIN domain-containing protein [Chloroflexota bacterium]|jgi:tRNA(fMet)-specific endonuclease VapC|nr:PIN domain-containing protein [Chloroflexota bacterium]
MNTQAAIPRTMHDTDIFSEFLRGRNAAVAARAGQYQRVHRHFTICAITLMEMCSGWQRRGQQARSTAVLQHISAWEILAIDGDIAALAGQIDGDLIRTGQPIGVADALIAATVLHHGLVLAPLPYHT